MICTITLICLLQGDDSYATFSLQPMQYKVFKAISSPDVSIRNALDLHSKSLLSLDEIYFFSVCNCVYKSHERNGDSLLFLRVLTLPGKL